MDTIKIVIHQLLVDGINDESHGREAWQVSDTGSEFDDAEYDELTEAEEDAADRQAYYESASNDSPFTVFIVRT